MTISIMTVIGLKLNRYRNKQEIQDLKFTQIPMGCNLTPFIPPGGQTYFDRSPLSDIKEYVTGEAVNKYLTLGM